MTYHIKITMHFDDTDIEKEREYNVKEGIEPYYPPNTKREWWKSYDVPTPEEAMHAAISDFAKCHMEYYTYGKPVTFAICNEEYDEIMRKKEEKESEFAAFFAETFGI